MARPAIDRMGLLDALTGDGRTLLSLSATGLVVAGAFAWFLAATGQLLPHDLAWLTITEAQLRSVAGGRVVHFMAHDRAAFGGTLIAVGVLYLWLIRFPLAEGRAWAWWLLAASGALGFLSFLTYLGTGYLDTWHGVATLALLPPFVGGLARARRLIVGRRDIASLVTAAAPRSTSREATIGRRLLLVTGAGMVVAGLVIATIGSLVVFVPEDIAYIGMDRAALDAIDRHLVPLIAHDRAGFGGGLATTGLVVLGCIRFARPSRALWEALLVGGAAGFGAAIGVHPLTGYLSLTHVAPAAAAGAIFALGMLLSYPAMVGGGADRRAAPTHASAGASRLRAP